jgi:ketosteroid isomerase-like protein
MDERMMSQLTEAFLAAWNSQNVERVLACYTEDLVYRDPNTRGAVEGQGAMRRYLTKLFAGWQMHWEKREARLFEGGVGGAVLWRATFQRPGGAERVTIDGMDLVEVRGELLSRNEVYFDRAALAPLVVA